MKGGEGPGARWTALALPALITFLAGIAVHCAFSFKPQLPESRFCVSVSSEKQGILPNLRGWREDLAIGLLKGPAPEGQ